MAWLCLSGQVRLVSKTPPPMHPDQSTRNSRCILNAQSTEARKWRPAEDSGEGVSHPSARELPSGPWRWAKVSIVLLSNSLGALVLTPGPPAASTSLAKVSKSGTLENNPAWPATPCSREAFSS